MYESQPFSVSVNNQQVLVVGQLIFVGSQLWSEDFELRVHLRSDFRGRTQQHYTWKDSYFKIVFVKDVINCYNAE